MKIPAYAPLLNRLNLGCSILADFNQDISRHLNGILLDIGCGQKQEIFESRVRRYIGLDYPLTRQINEQLSKTNADIFSKAEDLPFKDGSFDSVVSLSVFEHLSNPQKAANEIFRALKKEGIFAVTVPFMNRIHSAPFDFYRFTEYGIKYIIESAGFRVLKIQDSGGMWKVICIRLAGYFYSDVLGLGYGVTDRTNKPRPYLLPFFAPIIFSLLMMALILDKLHCVKKDTLYYYVLAQKP